MSFVRPFRFLRSRGRFGEASLSLILSVAPLVVATVFLAAAGVLFSSAFNELKTKSARNRVSTRPVDRNRLERNSHQISSKSVSCGASYGVSTVTNVQKRIPVRMRNIFWGGVQPISVRGGVQPITIIITTTSRSRWHGGVGELNFQPYCDGRSGTGEKETHSINVVGRTVVYLILECDSVPTTIIICLEVVGDCPKRAGGGGP